jgi:hypothetical protein
MFTGWLLIPPGGMKMEMYCRVIMKKNCGHRFSAGKTSKDWRIFGPEASSKSPLVVQFPKPLDHALALNTCHNRAFNNIIQENLG